MLFWSAGRITHPLSAMSFRRPVICSRMSCVSPSRVSICFSNLAILMLMCLMSLSTCFSSRVVLVDSCPTKKHAPLITTPPASDKPIIQLLVTSASIKSPCFYSAIDCVNAISVSVFIRHSFKKYRNLWDIFIRKSQDVKGKMQKMQIFLEKGEKLGIICWITRI